MSRTFLLSLCVTASVAAYSALQTDWSGGPRVAGPVTEFRSSFYECSNIDYAEMPGSIGIGSQSSIILVDSLFPGVVSIHPADVDGDGDLDIAGMSVQSGDVVWWENAGGGAGSWMPHLVDTGFTGAGMISAGDLDGDGDIDLVGSSKTQFGTIDVTLWLNDDGAAQSWTSMVVDGSFDGARSVCTGDVDGDGDTDILGAAAYADEIAWWENLDGSASEWDRHTIDDDFDGAWSVSAADIDGDGDLDVVGTAYYLDAVSVWFGEGGSWTREDVATGFDGAYCACAADVDGDGSLDIIGAAAFSDAVTWWDRRTGSWTAHEVDTAFDGAVCVCSADFDSDGDLDLAGAAVYGDEIRWWENTDGGWVTHNPAPDLDGAMSVFACDIDGDGEADPVFAGMGAGRIEWWDRRSGDGYLESSVLDTGLAPEWGALECIADVPEGCILQFQVRASDDILQMGDWSEPADPPLRLSSLLQAGDNLFQYRVLLGTGPSGGEPYLDEVTVTWQQEGMEGPGGQGAPGALLLPVSPNPSNGLAIARVSLDEPAVVTLQVFDTSGRMVLGTVSAAFDAGVHQVPLDGLSPGVYVCRAESGGFHAVRRFVVIGR